ncbi:hypothetical protein FRB99_006668 [Tulasnella sp. 403]|nr:hypothetical protein FRB99_006668 [Tulasnella sp. 403]
MVVRIVLPTKKQSPTRSNTAQHNLQAVIEDKVVELVASPLVFLAAWPAFKKAYLALEPV